MNFVTFSCVRRINLYSTFVRARCFSSKSDTEYSQQTLQLKESIDNLMLEVIQPHLHEKTDLVSDNSSDYFWMDRDVEALNKLRERINVDKNLLIIKENFIGLIDGLLVHVNNRRDILELNHGKTKVENGLLIRKIYNYADENILTSCITLLKQAGLMECDQFEAYFCAELRRLIRSTMRISASLLNANLSAHVSLRESACVFPDRDREVLSKLGIYKISKEINEKEKSGNIKEIALRKELEDIFIDSIPRFFGQKKTLPELVKWSQNNSFGFTFQDLLLKYMVQGVQEVEACKKIILSSSKANTSINERVDAHPPTFVSQKYIDELEKTLLSPVLRSKNKLYTIVQKRFFHTNTKITNKDLKDLNDILDNVILKEPIVWTNAGLTRLKVNIDDKLIAYLYLGNEESNATIKVTNGIHSAIREISFLWLNNWSVELNTDSKQVSKKD